MASTRQAIGQPAIRRRGAFFPTMRWEPVASLLPTIRCEPVASLRAARFGPVLSPRPDPR